MRLLALALTLLYVASVPIALVTPTDPAWIWGLYDGGDSDDVLYLVSSGKSLPHVQDVVLDLADTVPDRIGLDDAEGRPSNLPRQPSGRSPPRLV